MVERFHYSLKQKLQIIAEFQETNDPQCYLTKEITKNQFHLWQEKAHQMNLIPEDKQTSTYIIHPGPQRKYNALYTYLYQIVNQMRAERQAVTYNFLIEIACNELPEVFGLSYTGKRSLIDRFMSFHNLSLSELLVHIVHQLKTN